MHPHHLAVELTERGQYLARVQKSVYWLRTPVKVCMNCSREWACVLRLLNVETALLWAVFALVGQLTLPVATG